MPKLANRNNAMPTVQPPAPTEPEPQKPSIAESTADAFDKESKQKITDYEEENNIDMSISEIPPAQTEPIDIPQKQKKPKKPCSDKLKAHLARCREKSLAKRRANKAQPKSTRQEQVQPVQPTQAVQPIKEKPAEYKNVNQSQSIDYDRIINGVSQSLYSRFGLDEPDHQPPPHQPTHVTHVTQRQPTPFHHQPISQPTHVTHAVQQKSQKEMLIEYEKKIREDERNRMKAERQTELDRTFKSKGMAVLKNGMPTHRGSTNVNNNNNNPYANAFGRRRF